MKHLGIFFLIIFLGIISGCFVGGIIDFLPGTGMFTSWELLHGSVKFTQIIQINSDGIWAETTTNKLYFWGFSNLCFDNPQEICNQWVEIAKIPGDAYRNDFSQMSKDKICPQKGSVYPKKYPGDIIECAHVFLRRGPGLYSTYFALMKDGTVWEWALPPGTDTFGMMLSVGPLIGLLLGIIVGIGYVIIQSYRFHSLRVKPTKRAADGGDSSAIYRHFPRFELILLSSMIHTRPPSAANAGR